MPDPSHRLRHNASMVVTRTTPLRSNELPRWIDDILLIGFVISCGESD